jgi:hypothetical protein
VVQSALSNTDSLLVAWTRVEDHCTVVQSALLNTASFFFPRSLDEGGRQWFSTLKI